MYSYPIDLESYIDRIGGKITGYADINFVSSVYHRAIYRRGKIPELHRNQEMGVAFRILSGSSELSLNVDSFSTLNRTIDRLVDKHKKEASPNIPLAEGNVYSSTSLLHKGNITSSFIDNFNTDVIPDFISMLEDQLPDDFSFEIELEGSESFKSFHSTEGSKINQSKTDLTLSLLISAKKERYKKLVERFGGINRETLTWNQLLKIGNRLSEDAKQLKNARPMKSSFSDLVLSADSTWSVIHECIGHAVEANQSFSSQNAIMSYLGAKVAHTGISIIDDKGVDSFGSYEFDDEGQKGLGTILVEDGILTGWLTDRKSAYYLGSSSTGNGRLFSYRQPVATRQSNLFLEPGNVSMEEMLEHCHTAFYVGPTLLASADPITGVVSLYPQYFREIKDGELGQFYIGGNITDQARVFLKNIDLVGKNVINNPAYCYKGGVPMKIGMISPPTLVRNLRVST